jgi:hypothetical protein
VKSALMTSAKPSTDVFIGYSCRRASTCAFVTLSQPIEPAVAWT